MKNARANTSIQVIKINIKRLCKENGINTSKLCKLLGKNRNHISQLENPSIRTMVDIANAIGCRPSDLMVGL